MVSAVHVFQYVKRNVHCGAKLIFDCDFLAFDVSDNIVCCLWEPLCYLKFLWIPKRFRGSRWLGSNQSSTNDERCCVYEVLANLCLCFVLNSLGKIADCDLWSWRYNKFVRILHDIEHEVAVFIHLYDGEIDLTGGKLAHLISYIEAVRGAFRILVADGVTGDVNTVTRSISYQKCLFNRTGTPCCF